MKKTRAQFILLVTIALIITPVAASSENITNSTTTVPTLTEINLTTATTYPANVTTTVIPTNVTQEPIPMNTTIANTTIMTVVPTGTSVAPSLTGNLTIASSPLGASILIDGVLYGNTPENVTGISAGNHIIRLTLSGYYDYEGTTYVIPGEITDVFGTLPPLSVSSFSSSTGSATLPTTVAPTSVATVQPTSTSSGGLLDNPTIVASLIGIATACIGAFAAIFPHLSKAKK